jgi:BioD-like phosphotransacetylase family protein
VASQVKAKVLLVANGGLGSSFDELELNRLAYQHHNVEVIGVVLNKCKPSKIPMLKDYFSRVLKERWNVPLLGVIPQDSFLTQSTLIDLVKHLDAEQVAGEKYGDQHYDTHSVTMVATNLTRFLERLQINFDTNQHGTKSPLILSHVTRNDIILGYLSHWQKCKSLGIEWTGALVLASGSNPNAPSGRETLQAHVLSTIVAMDVPVLLVKGSNTFQISKCQNYDSLNHVPVVLFCLHILICCARFISTVQKMDDFTPKMHADDTKRVQLACEHVSDHVDFEQLARLLDTEALDNA